jgi:ammonia channel protein AmtB
MRNSNENLVDFGGLINGIFAGFIAITASNNCVETWAALLLDLSEE